MKNKLYLFVIPIVIVGAFISCAVFCYTQRRAFLWIGAAGIALITSYVYLRERRYEKQLSELLRLQEASVSALVDLAQMRDAEVMGKHLDRLGFYAEILAEDLGLTLELKENIMKTIALHDIGKVAIPDQILNKPGPLDQDEWALIRQHPQAGALVLDSITEKVDVSNKEVAAYLGTAREIALNHHEKWDGSGYPRGLKGEKIPLSARVAAVCDVYDSLRSARPYKRAFSHQEAVEIIRSGKGTHFDPLLVDSFERLASRFDSVWEKYGE